MSSSTAQQQVVPAQLAFLAIYNPAFGDSDETAYEQIFYYYSRHNADPKRKASSEKNKGGQHENAGTQNEEEQKNERLRQVGLARGMVEFANNFSTKHTVDSIETEKSRIVLHQLEPGWWVLASIDLTRLPAIAKSQKTTPETAVEYSSREVAPTTLLIAQLARAHRQFLLHQAPTLNELHSRRGRPAFSAILEKYWDRFSRSWDVLLHGNPIVDVYGATKLAGGGEIGIGVGEEEWGSGEREVLEDFVHRTEGLLDVVVGRYGDPLPDSKDAGPASKSSKWLGKGDDPRAADGIVFSGTGALARKSLATVSQWMEVIFTDGEDAYGIGENPSSRPRAKRRQRKPGKIELPDKGAGGRSVLKDLETHPKVRSPRNKPPDYRRTAMENAATPPGIPPPLVHSVERSLADAAKDLDQTKTGQVSQPSEESNSYFDTDKMVSYLKLGYGSSWTLNPKGFTGGKVEKEDKAESPPQGEQPQTPISPQQPLAELDPTPELSEPEEASEKPFVQHLEQSVGRFLVGLSGDLENTEFEADVMDDNRGNEAVSDDIRNTQRIFMRTITVELHAHHRKRARSSSPSKSSSRETHDKVQVVVYVHQPFIFVFLFALQTPSLSVPSLYRSIHHQLGPLQRPLLRSTDPHRIPDRLVDVLGEKATHLGAAGIYDLIYDPTKLTVRTSIPNIPLPGTLAAEGLLGVTSTSSSRTVSGAWYTLGIPIGTSTPPASTPSIDTDGSPSTLIKSDYTRLDALNIHSHLLHSYIATRPHQSGAAEFERTVKTSRGWWAVWMRAPVNPVNDTRHPTPSASEATTPGEDMAERIRKEGSRPDVTGRGVEVEAFLVRKAVDAGAKKAGAGGRKSGSSGKWLLGVGGGGVDSQRSVSGASAASNAGATSARGVVEGVGVDARKWVEGLVRLSS